MELLKKLAHCAMCGTDIKVNNDGSFLFICNECREAFLAYKNDYFIKKKLTETTELDEQVFQASYEAAHIDDLIKDEYDNPLFPPSDENVFVKEILSYILKYCDYESTRWLNQKEGRMEKFLAYVEKRMHEFIQKYKNKSDEA